MGERSCFTCDLSHFSIQTPRLFGCTQLISSLERGRRLSAKTSHGTSCARFQVKGADRHLIPEPGVHLLQRKDYFQGGWHHLLPSAMLTPAVSSPSLHCPVFAVVACLILIIPGIKTHQRQTFLLWKGSWYMRICLFSSFFWTNLIFHY